LAFRQNGLFFAQGLDRLIPLEAAREFRFSAQRDFRASAGEWLADVASLHPIAPDGQITISSVIPDVVSSHTLMYLAVIHFAGLVYHDVIQLST
jgi:hypothetical protein